MSQIKIIPRIYPEPMVDGTVNHYGGKFVGEFPIPHKDGHFTDIVGMLFYKVDDAYPNKYYVLYSRELGSYIASGDEMVNRINEHGISGVLIGDVLEYSRSRHDFIPVGNTGITLDGGFDYHRVLFSKGADVTNIKQYFIKDGDIVSTLN